MDERISEPTISVGMGKQNPQGSARPAGETVEDWVAALTAIPDGECSWWSPHIWTRNYSLAADWIGAHGCAIDIDYEDPTREGNRHTELPAEAWAEFFELAGDDRIPGNLIHATPRGARVVFVFDQVCTHRDQMRGAMEAAALLVESALQREDIEAQLSAGSGNLRAGFSVDRACLDLKRIFWAPRCTVAGARREAPVVAVRSRKYVLAELRLDEEPAESKEAKTAERVESSLVDAVKSWCEANPIDFSSKTCPMCRHNECFGPLDGDLSKWFCFSANHLADSGGIGKPGSSPGTAFGDALDIEAHRRSVAPAEVLRVDGFLVDDLSHIDISGLIDGRKDKRAWPIQILKLDAVLSITPPPPIIEGFLREQDLAVLYGPPGVGKSFVAIGLALSVASGMDWMGMGIEESAPVLYMAGEGVYGLHKRVTAWAGGAIPARSPLWRNWNQCNDLVPLLDPVGFRTLLDVIDEEGVRPRLIVIDTLARAMTGGDENSAKDMGLFVLRCAKLRDRTGAAILLVHHTRGDGERERGSSALRGAADVMIALSSDDEVGGVRLSVDKTKDDEPPDDMLIHLERIALGKTDKGKEIASLRAILHSGEDMSDALGAKPMAIVEVLKQQPAGAPEMSFGDLHAATKIPKSSIGRIVRLLEDQGVVQVSMSGRSKIVRMLDLG